MIAALSPTATPEANRDALQAALLTGEPVHIPRGAYPIAGPVSACTNGQVLSGDGVHATLLLCESAGPFLTDGEFYGFEVRDLNLIGSVGSAQRVTGGYAIHLDGNTTWNGQPGQTPNSRIRRVRMEGMWGGIFIQDQNNLIVDGLDMQAMQGDGIVAQSLNDNLRTDAVTLRDVVFSAAPAAVAAGRGTGIVIDGNVQTVLMDGVNIVAPLRGLDVRNSAGLPFGRHAAFLYARALMVDFPEAEAVRIAAIDQARFAQCYFHGSRQGNGLYFGPGVRGLKISDSNTTGHWANGMHSEAQDVDLIGVDANDNGQMGVNAASGLYFGAGNVVVMGGGAWRGRHAYGIARQGSGAVTIVASRYTGGVAPRLGC